MTEIPIETKQQIVQREIDQWAESQYLLGVRYRVNKRIGSDAEALKRIEAELERCEKAIDALNEELRELAATPIG